MAFEKSVSILVSTHTQQSDGVDGGSLLNSESGGCKWHVDETTDDIFFSFRFLYWGLLN